MSIENLHNAIENFNDQIYDTCKFSVSPGEVKTGAGEYRKDITTEFDKQEIINKISETKRIIMECMKKFFKNEQEQLDYALHEAIKLTESQYGHLYFYDEKTMEFTLNSWTNKAMGDFVVIEKQTKHRLDKTGMWGEVVRQRKPIIVNDLNIQNSLRKGCPEGHIKVDKYISVPIFENEQIVAVTAFANKKTNYTQSDVDLIIVFLTGVWMAAKKVKKEKELKYLLNRTKSMFNDHEAIMLLIEPFSGKIIEANNAAVRFYGYSKEELLGMSIQNINILHSGYVSKLRLDAMNKSQRYFAFMHRLKNGEIRAVDVYSSPIEYDGNKLLYSIIFDVTKREEVKKQNEHLVYHDYLTGIYNRRYFEEEFERHNTKSNFPIAILLGDVDGLKLFNDTFGHTEGDKILKEIAQKIKKLIKSEDMLARVGGNEFVIMVARTSEEKVREYLNYIDQNVNCVSKNKSKHSLTISFGYGIQRKDDDGLDNLIKEAETFLNNRKYFNNRSKRSNIVNVMMNTLFEKSEREKKHSERVGFICEAISIKMQLEKLTVDRTRVAGLLHDIGKIGISEEILNKIGSLNKIEWEMMKLHSIKGARILENSEFHDISYAVLSHHECYNGTGYPNGLKGEEIPIESRIIAVADAYDAMINERTYRKAMSQEDVISELCRCSGTQFDPDIVSLFIEKVLSEISFQKVLKSY